MSLHCKYFTARQRFSLAMTRFALLLMLLAAPAALAVDVEGYVYTPDGTPVAKAAVTAGSQRATTSDDGHFKVTAPADSIVNIEVRAANMPAAKLLALAGDPPLTITLGREDMIMTTSAVPMRAGRATSAPVVERDRVITGIARIGKKPLANAPVMIHGLGEVYHSPTTITTDDKGRYRINVAAGRYMVAMGDGLSPRLRSIHESRMYADSEMQYADVTQAREASQDVELVAAQLIAGRVLDADGKPVARADVMLVPSGRPTLEYFHQPITRTFPDGRFAVPAPPFEDTNPVEIVVTPPRHSSTRSKAFPLAQAKNTTITLPRFETVTVRVTDRAGKALTDANVSYAGAEEIASFGDPGVLLMPHAARRRVKTDAGGTAMLHLEADDYVFAASAPKHQQQTTSRSIARATTIDIALETGHQIRGRVHRGKQPVSGAHVTLRGGTAPRGERAVQTDEKGEFVFDALPRETFTVAVFKAEEMVDRVLTVEAPAELDIDLPPVAVLRGRVIDAATGKPVPQFLYSLESLDEPRNERRRGGHQRGESREDGTFDTTVPVGAYRIVAAATGFIASEPREVRIVEGEQAFVEIPLSRGATVSGRVIDEQGKPVLEAQVMVMSEIGEITRSSRSVTRMGPMSATTGEDGTFTITGVETGSSQVIVRARGYVMQRKTIDVEPQTRVDITLARGLTVSGIVTLNGKPIAGANVDATTSALGSDHQSAATDERGRFTLEGLIAARYTLNANFETHHAQVGDVDPGQRREVTIELDGRGRGVVFGTVSGLPRDSGKMARGTVFAQSTERGAEGMIDASGNYRIENAPAGLVDIAAHVETAAGSRSTVRKRVALSPGQTMRVDLDLTPALIVSGRVTHGASKPVARAQVVFHNEEFGMVNATTREDGTYEAGLPASGRYQVFVHAEALQSRSYQTSRDVRGSETFDVHLAEQTIEGIVLDAATGLPIREALVTLVPREAVNANMPAFSGETITDLNGRFTLVVSASGPHLLIASAAGYAQRSQEVLAGGSAAIRAQFELAPASELRVRVVDARNGTPLEAHLVIADEKGTLLPIRPRRTADGSEFVFSLAPGKYRVKVVTIGYAEKTVEVSAPGGVVIGME